MSRASDRMRRGRSGRRRLIAIAGGGGVVAAALAAVVVVIVAAASAHPAAQAPDGQIAPALEARIDRETGGRLETVHFYSTALHREADYLIFYPAGESPAHRYPVFYMLHGMPGKPIAFTVNANVEVKLARLLAERRVRPMLLVFPDGRIDGRTSSDSEWANTPSGDYESYVTDVVADVDRLDAALACRQERAIAGLSAGAYGAANIGLHQVSLFGLVQAWSGYFVETHSGVFAHAAPATLAYDSPLDYVRTMRPALRRYPLRVYLYAGRDDPAHAQVPGMAEALARAGARQSWAIVPGGHSWRTWTPYVDKMLIMASDDFAHPLARGASPSCR